MLYNDNKKGSKNPQDVKEFDGDDAYDETRYATGVLENLLDSSDAEHQRLVKQGRIEDKLVVTQDQTAYYRAMEKFERENQEVSEYKLFHSPKFNTSRRRR